MAVAMVSKRSATVSTMSGWSAWNWVASSMVPSPTDFAMVIGVSPSTIECTIASGSKPSRRMTSMAEPKR